MTPEEEISRKKKFAAISADCKRPEHLQKFFHSYTNDCYYTIFTNFDSHYLSNPFIKETLDKLTPTTGWRKEIHDKLGVTIFKKFCLPEPTAENGLQIYAYALGVLSNVFYASGKMEKEWDSTDDLLAEAIFPSLPEENSEPTLSDEQLEKLQRLPIEGLTKLLKDAPPTIQKEVADEFSKGTMALFKDDLSLTHETNATKIYDFLLYLGDYVDAFSTIEELYDFMAERLTPEELGGLTAFRQLCTRIKIKSS